MMISPDNQALAPRNAECVAHDPEAFVPLETMERMVWETLEEAGHIDEHGQVQPVTVERRLHDPAYALGPLVDSEQRSDIFVPTAEERKLYRATDEQGTETKNRLKVYTLESCLYECLTGATVVQLSDLEVDWLSAEKKHFESFFVDSSAYKIHLSDRQSEPAYHVEALQEPEPEFATTRVYVPAGVGAVAVAHTVFERGASMNYAKIWTQAETSRPQSARYDAPIFEVTTHDQLRSIVSVLRELAEDGRLSNSPAPLAGQAIDGLPGVYLGQTRDGRSFNGDMGDLFGGAIQSASEQVKLHAGDVVDSDILGEIAAQARLLAQALARKMGRDVASHAFLVDQPITDIMETIRRA